MGIPTRLTLLVVLNLFVLSIFVLHGCTRIRIMTHPSSTASLQTVQGDLEFARSQVEKTDEALDELAVTQAEDLKQACRVFSKNVDKMGMIGERLVKHANGMRDSGDYLVETEKSATQCRFPRLSENAGTQPLQLGEAFKPIYEGSKEVKHAYRAYYFDISNIRDQLSRNMTLKVIESMDPLFRKAQADSVSLTEALNQELGALQDAKPRLRSAARREEIQAGSAPGGDIQSSPDLGGDIQSNPSLGEDR